MTAAAGGSPPLAAAAVSPSDKQTSVLDFLVREASSRQHFGTAFEPGVGSSSKGDSSPPARTFNHGSFGRPCEKAKSWQNMHLVAMERQPDVWFRRSFRSNLRTVTSLVEEALNCPTPRRRHHNEFDLEAEGYQGGGLVLGDNTTFFLNSVVNHLEFKENDTIILHSRQYDMTSNHCLKVSGRPGGPRILRVDLLPILARPEGAWTLPEDFEAKLTTTYMAVVEEAKRQNLTVRLVVLEHIVSNPSVVLPFAAVAEAVKASAPGCFICVDGAHAWGSVPLDLSSKDMANVDAYISNAHKWMYSVRGCAMMYTPHDDILPALTSSLTLLEVGQPRVTPLGTSVRTSIHDNFEYHGTKDNTAILSIEGSLNFREQAGDSLIIVYQKALAIFSAVYLSQFWGTSFLGGVDRMCAMATVEVPGVTSAAAALRLQEWLLHERDLYICPIAEIGGKWYTRVSCPVYITKKDIFLLGDHILDWPEMPADKASEFKPAGQVLAIKQQAGMLVMALCEEEYQQAFQAQTPMGIL